MPVAQGTLEVVRRAVRSVVDATPGLRKDAELRSRVAQRMEQVSLAAARLIEEDRRLTGEMARARVSRGLDAQAPAPPPAPAQASGPAPLRATTEAGQAVRNLREALDFPTFVTSLITGVFHAITHSTLQQLEEFANLLDGVQLPASSFANSQVPEDGAVTFLLSRFDAFSASTGEGGRPVVALREGAEMPDADTLKSALDLTDDEAGNIDESDLSSLVAAARRKIGRNRQQMLSTMLLMGMQRVVVDQGSIHATMELAVDARSATEQRASSQFDTRVSTSAQGSFGVGAWGASASVSATVGYVKADSSVNRDEVAARAGLRSSVDVQFRTEQIPLDRMANREALAHIRANQRVPDDYHPQSMLGTGPMPSTTQTTFAAPPAATMPVPPPLPPRDTGRGTGSGTAPGGGTGTGTGPGGGTGTGTGPGAGAGAGRGPGTAAAPGSSGAAPAAAPGSSGGAAPSAAPGSSGAAPAAPRPAQPSPATTPAASPAPAPAPGAPR